MGAAQPAFCSPLSHPLACLQRPPGPESQAASPSLSLQIAIAALLARPLLCLGKRHVRACDSLQKRRRRGRDLRTPARLCPAAAAVPEHRQMALFSARSCSSPSKQMSPRPPGLLRARGFLSNCSQPSPHKGPPSQFSKL